LSPRPGFHRARAATPLFQRCVTKLREFTRPIMGGGARFHADKVMILTGCARMELQLTTWR
jgi:hypothetical protein